MGLSASAGASAVSITSEQQANSPRQDEDGGKHNWLWGRNPRFKSCAFLASSTVVASPFTHVADAAKLINVNKRIINQSITDLACRLTGKQG